MATPNHTDAIDWPNGQGYTPCTPEYASKLAEREAIYDPNHDKGSLEDRSPEDYERWHTLDNELAQMLAAGHVGKAVRW